MDEKELAKYIGAKIKEYRKLRGLTQKELAQKIKMGDTTVANYEKGFRSPKKDTMFALANAFDISIDDLFPPINSVSQEVEVIPSTLQQITDTLSRLEHKRQLNVLDFAKNELQVQNTIQEESVDYDSERVVKLYKPDEEYELLIVHGLESAGDGIWQEDDADIEVRIPKSEIPDKFDDLAMVIGDSMLPKLHNGDILFITFTKQIEIGEIGVFRTSKGNFVKRLQADRLESLNPDYDDIYFSEDEYAEAVGVVVDVYRK